MTVTTHRIPGEGYLSSVLSVLLIRADQVTDLNKYSQEITLDGTPELYRFKCDPESSYVSQNWDPEDGFFEIAINVNLEKMETSLQEWKISRLFNTYLAIILTPMGELLAGSVKFPLVMRSQLASGSTAEDKQNEGFVLRSKDPDGLQEWTGDIDDAVTELGPDPGGNIGGLHQLDFVLKSGVDSIDKDSAGSVTGLTFNGGKEVESFSLQGAEIQYTSRQVDGDGSLGEQKELSVNVGNDMSDLITFLKGRRWEDWYLIGHGNLGNAWFFGDEKSHVLWDFDDKRAKESAGLAARIRVPGGDIAPAWTGGTTHLT